MSGNVQKFLLALDAVKQDFTCGVCSKLCRNPVTLSKCFHIICEEHFDGLKNCPDCKIELDGCTTYSDDRLGPCIDSAMELDKIFLGYRKEAAKQPSLRSANTSKKKSAIKINQKAKELTPYKKANKSDKINKSKAEGNKSNLNQSLASVSRFNKRAEKKNTKGETLLHSFSRLGKLDKVMELLKQGANTNTKDNAGWTPLHEAVQNGQLDLVKLLLEYNTLINTPGQGNETPLHEAIRYKHNDIAELLVRNGADMNARNCKGETPFQLASTEVKNILLSAADNIIQTQTVNINHMITLHSELDYEDIRLYCVSKFRTVFNRLKFLTKTNPNLHIETKFTEKVTHLLVDADDNGVCQSTLDVLQGIVSSVWIITSKWATESFEHYLEPFEKYEVTGVSSTAYKGPQNARLNKFKQLPGIFDGCHFYLHNFVTKYEIANKVVISKEIMAKLITDAGGVFLRRAPNPELIPEEEKLIPYHAKKGGKLVNCSHYIIFKDVYKPMYNMQHLKALPIGWLIECIEKYELCEPW